MEFEIAHRSCNCAECAHIRQPGNERQNEYQHQSSQLFEQVNGEQYVLLYPDDDERENNEYKGVAR